MGLSLTVDTLDDVPEPLRELYQEREGKFVLDVEGVPDIAKDVGPLRRAYDSEKQQRARLAQENRDLQSRLKELEEHVAASAREPVDANKEVERLKREYDERLKAIEQKLAHEVELRTTAEQRLTETRISDVLRQTAIEMGVPQESVEDLIQLPKFRQPWRLSPEGEPAPYDGDVPRLDPDSPSKTMSAKAYVREYLKDNKHWVPAPTGAGATGSGAARNVGGIMRVTRDQIRDHAAYNKIIEQAAKTGAQVEVAD